MLTSVPAEHGLWRPAQEMRKKFKSFEILADSRAAFIDIKVDFFFD
jgi:hypothetical protein